MKLYITLSIALVILAQITLSQAEKNSESRADSNRFKRSLVKRLHSQWGKRAESDSDELYQRILREIYYTAQLNQRAHPSYSEQNELNPLTLEQLLANRYNHKMSGSDAWDHLS